jgi:hypothetical protein
MWLPSLLMQGDSLRGQKYSYKSSGYSPCSDVL